MSCLNFAAKYESSASATDALFDRLAASERGLIEQRPAPRVWSAEEYARHLVWIEDTLLRVECLGLDPLEFPDGFAILPGQALERHFDIQVTRDLAAQVRDEARQALGEPSPELLAQTVEDSGGRTVADNLARYLEQSAGARACAYLVLRLVP